MILRSIIFSFLLLLALGGRAQTDSTITYTHVPGYMFIHLGIESFYMPEQGNKYMRPSPSIAVGFTGSKHDHFTFTTQIGLNTIALGSKSYMIDQIELGNFPEGMFPKSGYRLGANVSIMGGGNYRIHHENKELGIRGLIGLSSLKMPGYVLYQQGKGSDEAYKLTYRVLSPGLATSLALNYTISNDVRHLIFELSWQYFSSRVSSSFLSPDLYEKKEYFQSVNGISLKFGFTPAQYFD